MALLKPPPVRSSRKSFPLKGPTIFRLTGALRTGCCGFVSRAIRPRWARPVTKRRRIIMTQSNAKAPTHTAYQVRDRGDGKKAFWTRIGSAWPHADGNGFNVQIDSVPLDGRITLRVVSEKKE